MTLQPRGEGIGILGVFFVIFVCAKVFGWEPVASWGWNIVPPEVWWILGIAAGLIAVLALIAGVMGLIDRWRFR